MKNEVSRSLQRKAVLWAGRSLLGALVAMAPDAGAQSFPTKPLRLIVPYSAGGPADTVGRLLAERLHQSFGQPVVVVVKDGAGTIIGTEYAARATADGYTILLNTTAIVTNALLYKKLPYDLQRDLEPLAMYYVQPNIVVVSSSSSIKSLKELLAYARTNPGKVRYGSSGVGAITHLYHELLARRAGVEFTHVPYKGVAPAVLDVLGGRIDFMFAGIAISAPHIKAGRLRPLAISTKQRSSLFPDIPSIAEQGVSDFDVKTWYGLWVPARTPRAIIERLFDEIAKVTADQTFRQRLTDLGGEAVAAGPDEFKAHIARELRLWGETIRSAKISLE
ncbi:MAG TPA: tripartite tricarboxylate transporter substrate binding protein [Burkholderiales bacterium]|nr:tripartite tricarboxylate transporter substrate binding protein [Burkholderiales bacterium]